MPYLINTFCNILLTEVISVNYLSRSLTNYMGMCVCVWGVSP